MAHKWARWLHNPYRLTGPQRSGAEDGIRFDPQVGRAVYITPARRLGPQHFKAKDGMTGLGLILFPAIRDH